MRNFVFNGINITTITFNNILYFRCNDIVTALGYKSSKREPINKFVSEKYITTFEKIRFDKSDKHNTKYIEKNGVIQIAFKCRLDNAKLFQDMVMEYIDSAYKIAIDYITQQHQQRAKSETLEYQTKLALTEKSHAEIIFQYKKRIEEKNRVIIEKDEEIEEMTEQIEQKDELLEEKHLELDDLEQSIDVDKIDECEEHDRLIKEMEETIEELKEENYQLKQFLNQVPKEYRGDYVEDDDFFPLQRSKKIDHEMEINAWFRSRVTKLRSLYENVDKWKSRYASTESAKAKKKYETKYNDAHGKLEEYTRQLDSEEFFSKCKKHLDSYPNKFWLMYNGKITY
jgi:prophage antirepressor-like protein